MVNKKKSVLLTNAYTSPGNTINFSSNSNMVSLNFGSENILIPVTPSSGSVRVLGVWVNLDFNKRFINEQCLDIVTSACNMMKFKKLVDKQLIYIYNSVIIPQIDYQAQLTILSPATCEAITSKFRSLLKKKSSLVHQENFISTYLRNLTAGV